VNLVTAVERELRRRRKTSADHKVVVGIIGQLVSSDPRYDGDKPTQRDRRIERLRKEYYAAKPLWERLEAKAAALGLSLLDDDAALST
jgi:hypothetical protein